MPIKKIVLSIQTAAHNFNEFKQSQSFGGFLLLLCTIIALFWANSTYASLYHYLLHVHLAIHLGDWGLNMQMETWVNDGLMAIFFLLVGLEIKRELLIGELSNPKKALLPIFMAAAGMAVPALIYVAFNFHKPDLMPGWGIPMATDIAFALGILSLLGKCVPRNLFVLLAAIAIVDDLGAVIVIACFYTNTIHLNFLLAGLVIFLLLMLMNICKIKRLTPYLLLGLVLWYCLLNSGVHATIAGVLLALAIPCRVASKESPLQKLERTLHTPVNFLIIPIFVIFNAGITISNTQLQYLTSSSLAHGILLGLILGKCIGLCASAWILVKFKLAQLPDQIRMSHILPMSLLGGIGFTMAIFITDLAFPGNEYAVNIAKLAIICASLIAAIFGYGLMRILNRAT